MHTVAHGGAREFDTTLAAALEAAAKCVRQRAAQVMMTARLATAVHMCRVAESTAASELPAAAVSGHDGTIAANGAAGKEES